MKPQSDLHNRLAVEIVNSIVMLPLQAGVSVSYPSPIRDAMIEGRRLVQHLDAELHPEWLKQRSAS